MTAVPQSRTWAACPTLKPPNSQYYPNYVSTETRERHTASSSTRSRSRGDPTEDNVTVPRTTTFKYVLGELLGKGSYGRVYLALNANNGELMAVKQVEIPQTTSDRAKPHHLEMVKALKFESKTLKDLEHPNIVAYLGFEETPQHLNIFLEYVPGGTIGSCLLKHGKFDEEVTKSFTSQILAGLEYLHSKGILHRDLKSDNILVETSGVCKISDFGISKKEDGKGQHTELKGTVYWMAPEVVDTERGYDSKVDIWSLGCVVLEMWSGQRPWVGHELITVMLKLHQEKIPPPIPADLNLSDLALDFREKCFARDPEARPAAAVLRRHPYLELTPSWNFQLSDIEKPNRHASTLSRRKGKGSTRHRNSSAPAPRHRRTATDVPAVPTTPRDGWPTVRPTGHLQLPSLDNSSSQPGPSRRRSPSRPPPADPPPIVYITPPSSPVRASSRNSNSPPTSESARTSASPRLRSRKSFYVVNPDPEPDEKRTGRLRAPYVYTPPPLPREDTLLPSSSQRARELQSRSSVADFATERRLAPAPSMQNLVGHLRTSSSSSSRASVDDSYSESDSDSNTGMWQKPPVELQKSSPSRQENKFAHRRSIIERKQDVTWAPRPGLQDVYSNLQDFFPRVDLDKPIVAPSADRQRRTKSIRMVAEINRDARLRRTATTTKLWGHRVEEMEGIQRN
ncbi:kinase-like domain-containing protein [Mycena maculata]|uniref:Kinase-like domain-containing protein n=1 Tax=Mycena maculata TaxID=230809 RepID=A0AAD7P1H5_9AGAR|nr:kinase-like domain-containing protein [Mycena maculata]